MAAIPSVLDPSSLPWRADEPAQPSSQRVALSFEYPVHFTTDVFSWSRIGSRS